MRVTCEVVGEAVREVALDADADYGDLLRALGFSRHEATVLVDGTPVPADAPVDAEVVRILRLVRGGDGSRPPSGDGYRNAAPRAPVFSTLARLSTV